MPSNEEKEAIKLRLKALFDVVYEEAINNPGFFTRLQEILLSPEAKLSLLTKSSSTPRPKLNLLEVLHQDGDTVLRNTLETYTNNDLAKLCSQEGVRKLKDAKSLDRAALINLLIETAISRLKQGESFVKRS